MRVLLIGATGLTGRLALEELKSAGHEVSAFVRAGKERSLPASASLNIAIGDGRDAASLAAAAKGQDAVLSTFGPASLRTGDLQETYMRNLIAAMTGAGVKRLVNLSAAGVGATASQMPFLFRSVLIPLLFKEAFVDKARGEKLLFSSPLDYVNVMPGRLTNGPARGGVKAQAAAAGLKLSMARADLAKFLAGQLISDQWVRIPVFIGY